MADLGISEFTFGFAFVSEQIRKNWGKIVSLPIFPSLIREKSVGYDVELPMKGKTFYYQFKTSELLRRKNSKYIRDGTYSGSYYRIKLHRMFNNNQHRMLKNLSRIEKDTYYVAPECADLRNFNDAFLNGKVTDQSRLIPLINCNDYAISDSDQHYITFEPGNSGFHQHSEISERKESILGINMGELYASRVKDFEAIDEKFSNKVTSNVIQLSKDNQGKKLFNYESIDNILSEAKTIYDRLALSANILWTLYGIVMAIVGEESMK